MKDYAARTRSALYRRSGTILLAGAITLLAGLLTCLLAALFLIGGNVLGDGEDTAFRIVGAVFLFFGVITLAVGVGILRIRPWARWMALANGALTVALIGLAFLATRDVAILFNPNLGALTAALLLVPGVGDAFREESERRRALAATRRR